MKILTIIFLALSLVQAQLETQPVKRRELGIGATGILGYLPGLSFRYWTPKGIGTEISLMAIAAKDWGNIYGDMKCLFRLTPREIGFPYLGAGIGFMKDLSSGAPLYLGGGVLLGGEMNLAFLRMTADIGLGYISLEDDYWLGPIGSLGIYWYF